MPLKLRALLLPFFVMVFSVFTTAVQAQTTDAYTTVGLALPTVSSDKDDYLPGEIAIISGTGWKLDQIVDVHFEEDPVFHIEHQHDYHGTSVDADGNWIIKYPIEERHRGVHFTVHVIGKQTGYEAQTTFTDGDIPVEENTLWSQLDRDLSTPGKQAPTATDRVIVRNGAILTVDVNNAVADIIQLGGLSGGQGDGTLTFQSNSQVQCREFVLGATGGGAGGPRNGNLIMSLGGTLRVSGSFDIKRLGTYTPGTGTVEFNGSTNQIIPNSSELGNISYNNYYQVLVQRHLVQLPQYLETSP
jgi:hypothetical protein